MKRYWHLSHGAGLRRAAVGACIAVACGAATPADSPPPNILFILVDDLGWRDLGCYGSTFYETPRIDALAAEGTRLTQAYAACPVCSPTRASILSGKYPARMDTTDWFGAPQPETVEKHHTRNKPLLPAPYVDRLPLEETTLAEAFRDAGYATFFAGKWHLGDAGFFPEDQGFEVNVGGHHRGSPPGGYFAPYKNPKLENRDDGEHLPARLAAETVAFMEGHRAEPFLAYLSFYSVHTPLQSRADLKAKYEAKAAGLPEDRVVWGVEGERKLRLLQDHAVYAGMVEAMDAAVGVGLDALDRLELAENTIVVFTSDNGGLSTSEGHPTSNLPLRAGKGWLYEGGIREPLLVRGPGVAAGRSLSLPVTSPDLFPTLLALAGLDPLPEQHLDGLNVAPALRGDALPADRPIFWHYPHYGNQGGSPGAAVRLGVYKLIHFYEDGRNELYHLEKDPSEQHNLAPEDTARVARLSSLLSEWQRKVDAKLPSRREDLRAAQDDAGR